jgi:molecular chaperone DnaJ
MSAKRDYYQVLGVERSASEKEISDAYRKLAIKFHPDRNPGNEEAVASFKEAAEAFEVLRDPQKRSRYDRYGHAGLEGVGAAPHFGDINDIFSAFGHIFGDSLFGDLFGGGRSPKGADLRVNVKLDLAEAAEGVSRTIEFERHEACSNCEGTGAKPGAGLHRCSYCGGRGQVIQTSGIFRVQTTCPSCRGAGKVIKDPCTTCRGAAYVPRKVRREVHIPAGIEDQMRVRLPGEGEPSPNGGPPGDVYCFVSVKKHPLFHREGQDLLVVVPITFAQAALGATIEVPTLKGRHELKVPAGTQPATQFRLRGMGLPHPRNRHVGDLVVQVSLEVPKSLSARQEELVRELAELEQVHVTPERKSFFDQVRRYFGTRDAHASAEE